MKTKNLIPLLKNIYSNWSKDDAPRLAAALAYYTAVSIAPLLVIIIYVGGMVLGEDAAKSELITQFRAVGGPEVANLFETVLKNADRPITGTLAGIISLLTLIWGSTNCFNELQTSLNRIWNIPDKNNENTFKEMLKDRIFSLGLVLGVGFLLLVSLVLSTVITFIGKYFTSALPGGEWIWQALNFLLSFLLIALLFSAIFKVLPDVNIRWKDTWTGAIFSAILFSIGKYVLGLYLASASSPYGAAGSLIAFLIWVYYSSQILFLGAEISKTSMEKNPFRVTAKRDPLRTNALTF